jgi:hypothetical protein
MRATSVRVDAGAHLEAAGCQLCRPLVIRLAEV